MITFILPVSKAFARTLSRSGSFVETAPILWSIDVNFPLKKEESAKERECILVCL